MFISYKFKKALIPTEELLIRMSISRGTLDFWKWKWRKDGNDCYDMGLRLVGYGNAKLKRGKAYWDPVQFVNWMSQFILINKPTTPEQKLDQSKAIMFIQKHVAVK